MKKIIPFLKADQTFILFLFVFSWIFTLKNKIGFASSWDTFVFHPDTPFWVFIEALFIFVFINYLKNTFEKNTTKALPSFGRYLSFFGISLIGYLLLTNVFGVLISVVFDTFSRNFNSSYQITYKVFNQIIDFTIFGSFSLAYLYYKENRSYKNRISAYEISNSKSKIQQLKAQLNPHFLFNNLNILDQLIEENQEKASSFLGQFSELYRYVLRNADKELITLQEEAAFAQNYFELMEKKYQGYYRLVVDSSIKTTNILVPPFCLQVLVENAIVHNLGTTKEPVIITISIKNGINITNNKVIQHTKKKGNGIALKNLSEQFELLTNSSIMIGQTKNVFSVILPVIKTTQHD
tara:strand:- start:738 stop:1790 length:1053 start_codon:yes stop_codon:yes gene_type:complete